MHQIDSTKPRKQRNYLQVVHELGGDQDAGDEQAVHIEGVDGERWLALREPVKVDVGDHVT